MTLRRRIALGCALLATILFMRSAEHVFFGSPKLAPHAGQASREPITHVAAGGRGSGFDPSSGGGSWDEPRSLANPSRLGTVAGTLGASSPEFPAPESWAGTGPVAPMGHHHSVVGARGGGGELDGLPERATERAASMESSARETARESSARAAAMEAELVTWLLARGLGALRCGLEALGAYRVGDLTLLDVRDERRLWMEVNLQAAARGGDVAAVAKAWELGVRGVKRSQQVRPQELRGWAEEAKKRAKRGSESSSEPSSPEGKGAAARRGMQSQSSSPLRPPLRPPQEIPWPFVPLASSFVSSFASSEGAASRAPDLPHPPGPPPPDSPPQDSPSRVRPDPPFNKNGFAAVPGRPPPGTSEGPPPGPGSPPGPGPGFAAAAAATHHLSPSTVQCRPLKLASKARASPPGSAGTSAGSAARRPLGFEQVAVFINSSPHGRRYFGANFQRNYYTNRAMPGLLTWGKAFPNLWVVMEDSPEAKQLVARPHCMSKAFAVHWVAGSNATARGRPKVAPKTPTSHASYATGNDVNSSVVYEYTCEGKPIILAPCDSGYWGAGGPCCKCEVSIRHLLVTRRLLFDGLDEESEPGAEAGAKGGADSGGQGRSQFQGGSGGGGGGGIRWFVFSDDDTFFVPSTMRRFLQGYDDRLPIVAGRGDVPGGLSYARVGTKLGLGTKCANPNLHVTMLQPAIFSRAGLLEVAPGIVDGQALVKTCEAFGITHDYALGVLAWMHGLMWQVYALSICGGGSAGLDAVSVGCIEYLCGRCVAGQGTGWVGGPRDGRRFQRDAVRRAEPPRDRGCVFSTGGSPGGGPMVFSTGGLQGGSP